MPLDTAHDETGTALRGRVRGTMVRLNISQAEVARRADIPASTLSQYMNARYNGDVGPVEDKLAKWLETQAATSEVTSLLPRLPDFVETPTGAKIIAALRYAQSARTITVIYGAPGVGKTKALRKYKRAASSVWIVTGDPMLAQLGALLDRIATVLGIQDARRDPASLRKAIIAKLMGSGGLLIVDEAQHLTDKAIEGVRSIHDAVNEDVEDGDMGLGAALVGNVSLYARIFGKGRGHDFSQVTSRIGKTVRIERVQDGDVRVIAAAFGLTGADELEAVREIARRPGGLRLVEKVVQQAWLLAGGEAPQGRPRLEHIQASFADLTQDAD